MKTITYDETKWKLVPFNATKAMQDAWDAAPKHYDGDQEFQDAYAAMLNAAPTPPADGHGSYWCVVCNKELPVVDGVVVHDETPHPPDADFNEEERPQ